jgi:hypothetical protein
LRAIPVRSGLTLAACAAAVVGLEALAYLVHGPFEWIAARLWALGGCGFAAFCVVAIARAAAGAIRDRCLTSLIMVPAVCFVALWGITGVDQVQLQHEATQEIAAGIEGAQEASWNYTGIGHLGYPNRQYLIAALPSLALGRGLPALRLGFALPFLFGAFLFWAGTREAFAIFLFGTPRLFVPPALYLPIMVVLVLGLIGKLRLPGLTIAWWTLAVIVASKLLTGYSVRPPSFDLLRALVVIPPRPCSPGGPGCASSGTRAPPSCSSRWRGTWPRSIATIGRPCTRSCWPTCWTRADGSKSSNV